MSLFILFAALGPAPELARPVPDMSYDEMLKKSDLVILGVFASESADKEPIDSQLVGRGKGYEGVTTKLRVLAVLKGETKEASVAIRHHRMQPDFRGLIINGPNFASFKPGKDYLVFLKKRPDGRYQCVTGQMDPEYSVKSVEPRNRLSDHEEK